MEYWSNDERIDVFFSNTPVLHYSKAETSKNCWQPFNYLLIGYNSENSYDRRDANCQRAPGANIRHKALGYGAIEF
jgi:hypothetical protein